MAGNEGHRTAKGTDKKLRGAGSEPVSAYFFRVVDRSLQSALRMGCVTTAGLDTKSAAAASHRDFFSGNGGVVSVADIAAMATTFENVR